MIRDSKLFCDRCRAFLGLVKSDSRPEPDSHMPACCSDTIRKLTRPVDAPQTIAERMRREMGIAT